MQFSFENLIFDIPKTLQKNTLSAQCDTICVFKNAPQHYKNCETVKNLDQFLTLDLDQFLTLETPNLGPVFNSTAYISAYMPTSQAKGRILPSHKLNKGTRRCLLWTAKM